MCSTVVTGANLTLSVQPQDWGPSFLGPVQKLLVSEKPLSSTFLLCFNRFSVYYVWINWAQSSQKPLRQFMSIKSCTNARTLISIQIYLIRLGQGLWWVTACDSRANMKIQTLFRIFCCCPGHGMDRQILDSPRDELIIRIIRTIELVQITMVRSKPNALVAINTGGRLVNDYLGLSQLTSFAVT